jgi:cbb3-type cytochrome oxidase subunit 3
MIYLTLTLSRHFGVCTESKKSWSIGVIIGAAAGGTVLVLLLLLAGVYAFRQKRRAERASEKLNPFGKISMM